MTLLQAANNVFAPPTQPDNRGVYQGILLRTVCLSVSTAWGLDTDRFEYVESDRRRHCGHAMILQSQSQSYPLCQ